MRDRRNTSLSVSSTSSSSSSTGCPPSTHDSLNEKTLSLSLSLSLPPPQSPTLPPPVTKENRPRPSGRRQLVLRLLAAISFLALIWRLATLNLPFFGDDRLPPTSTWHVNGDVELIGPDALPDAPAALTVHDQGGSRRWTVYIPPDAPFPLAAAQYREICRQGEILRNTLIAASPRRLGRHFMPPATTDNTYMDIAAAQAADALPRHSSAEEDPQTCSTSLTFALQGQGASFGKTLLMLWLSYGLAKQQGRAFFIDDTNWTYGSYSSFFAPPPEQSCTPPPPSHIVPCPLTARHVVVSAATADWWVDAPFRRDFDRYTKGSLETSRRMFELTRAGYEALFRIVGDDAAYSKMRINQLRDAANRHGHPLTGMHIRHGDLHPVEFEYQYSYLPQERYTSTALRLLRRDRRQGHSSSADDHAALDQTHPPHLVLATDDPNLLASEELVQAAKPFTISLAQDRLQLATKATLDRVSPTRPMRLPNSPYVKHVDENAGWEGGFYSALFYSLGVPDTHAKLDEPKDVPETTLRMRELVARGYILDLSILGQGDAVVCAVSSAACRILGVMMGWDAVKRGRWVNVDDGRPWSWDVRR